MSNIDKIIAAASSGLNKRSELEKLLKEVEDIKMKITRGGLEKEELENTLDKGYSIANRLTSIGKHSDALGFLGYLIIVGSKNGLSEISKHFLEKFYEICQKAIKEAREWGQKELAFILSLLVSVIESLNIENPPEQLRKEILDLETSPDINPRLLDLKREVNELLLSSQGEIDQLIEAYSDFLKGKGVDKELKILRDLMREIQKK